MKLNCNSFFPEYKFEYLNLNEFYLKNKNRITDTKRPELIQWHLNTLHKELREKNGVWTETYGGYGEYRGDIWKGTYMDNEQIYVHLGIDINAIAGSPIVCPFDAEVIDIFTDADTKIGWGGRIILRQCKTLPYLVLGHIEPDSIKHKTNFKKGEVVGEVGTWPTNGNTFQHLHVQCVYDLNINDFDGYGKPKDLLNNPNPFEVEFL